MGQDGQAGTGRSGLPASQALKAPAKEGAARKGTGLRGGMSGLCPGCGAPVDIEDGFCASCGHAVRPALAAVSCPSCGASIEVGDRFCPECGATIVTADPDAGTEIRNGPSPGVVSAPGAAQALPGEAPAGSILSEPQTRARDAAAGHSEAQLRSEKKETTVPVVRTGEASTEDRTIAQGLRSRLSTALSMEARKAAGVEEARRKVEEEERRRVEEVERLEGKVRSLDSENRELRRKNMEAIAANADLQARYQQIVAEKARLERLGRRLKWKCNFCGNLHDDPTECARPGLGGQWVDA